jgi:hypothetical protein
MSELPFQMLENHTTIAFITISIVATALKVLLMPS